MEITWRDKTITCEEGTTLFDISKQVEKEYEFPIIVAKVDGVIQELYHEVIDGTTVSFVQQKTVMASVLTYVVCQCFY